MPDSIVIVGATSQIASSFAREMASRGSNLHLIARDEAELGRIASDLRTRFSVHASASVLNFSDTAAYSRVFDESRQALGDVDGILFAGGVLGDQLRAQEDADEAAEIVEINYVSAVRFLTIAADYLEKRGKGFIIVVSSVAGDRGRPSNYVYGSSKGALSLFTQGLRARLYKKGVRVLTVKPGFVDTKMTFGKPGMFLVAEPQAVARTIADAISGKQDVLYVPWFWRWIMTVIKSIPEPVFKRMKL